jgi:hypothetical protein
VRNVGTAPLQLEAAWIPHGRFRGDRTALCGQIDPSGTRRLELAVTTGEAAGTVVENAFLILRVVMQAQAWRIFVRMRIEFDDSAIPRPVVEAITMQSLK